MVGIGDTTMGAVEYALRGLAARADVRANNLANINTPNFRAGRIDFESHLADALYRREMDGLTDPEQLVEMNLPGPNSNTASPEEALVGQIKDNLLRNAMINAYNFKVHAFRTAIGRR